MANISERFESLSLPTAKMVGRGNKRGYEVLGVAEVEFKEGNPHSKVGYFGGVVRSKGTLNGCVVLDECKNKRGLIAYLRPESFINPDRILNLRLKYL